MEKYVYIKKSLCKELIDFTEPLSPEEYNNLGETWEDYENNKWVLLSDEQIAYYKKNPTASIKEIWNMRPAIRTVEQAKLSMLRNIIDYDMGPCVNSFTIDGMDMWLTVEERQQLSTQISANEAAGRTEMTKWFNGKSFTFNLSTWKQMLIELEIYAGDALNVTESHKASLNALDSIESIDNYDYQSGYPQKLVFNTE